MPDAVGVRMEMLGAQAILDKIVGMEDRLANPEPALEVIADLLEAHVARNFETQGAAAGQPWRPLSPRTVRARTRRWGYYRRSPSMGAGPSSPILTWTGTGRRSFQKGHPGNVRIISPSGLTWGSSLRYMLFHQLGGARLPRRSPLAFKDQFQQRELVFQALRLWLQGVPAGAIRTVMGARTGLAIGAA